MYHYQVPSEFIRQKTIIFWFVTLDHAIAAFAGYLLGQALGGSTLATVVCMALALIVTTVRFQGLVLYRQEAIARGRGKPTLPPVPAHTRGDDDPGAQRDGGLGEEG